MLFKTNYNDIFKNLKFRKMSEVDLRTNNSRTFSLEYIIQSNGKYNNNTVCKQARAVLNKNEPLKKRQPTSFGDGLCGGDVMHGYLDTLSLPQLISLLDCFQNDCVFSGPHNFLNRLNPDLMQLLCDEEQNGKVRAHCALL